MKRITKKLALSKEVVRSLAESDYMVVQGGAPNPSYSFCEGGKECVRTEGRTCSNAAVC